MWHRNSLLQGLVINLETPLPIVKVNRVTVLLRRSKGIGHKQTVA